MNNQIKEKEEILFRVKKYYDKYHSKEKVFKE